MSDISGPPGQNNSQPIARVADSTASIGREPRRDSPNADRQNTENQRDTSQSQPSNARDPAVTISASTAGLQVGDQVAQQVQRLDSEGRPIIVTEEATFALRPDAGLRPGDNVDLRVVGAGRQIEAELVRQNDTRIDPPIRLELVVVAVNRDVSQAPPIPLQTETPAPTTDTTVAASETINQRQVNFEQQAVQISGTSATGQPIIVSDQATFEVSSNIPLETGDDITIQTQSGAAGASQTNALIIEQNGSPINPPAEIVLNQVSQNNQTLRVPTTAEEALALAQSQITGNIIPSITVTEADRTLPTIIDPRNIAASTNVNTASVIETASIAIPSPTPAPTIPATSLTIPAQPTRPEPAPAITDIANQIGQNPNFAAPLATTTGETSNSRSPLEPPFQSPIEAFTFAGRPQFIRVLDVSTSQVNPAIVAQVTGFTPLTVDETRSLSLPINAFAQINDELARLQTSRGSLILPLEAARSLVGETIELVPEAPAASASRAASEVSATPPPASPVISGNTLSEGIGQTGVGAYLQNLPTYEATLQTLPNGPPAQISVAVLPRTSVETAARQAATGEISDRPRQSSGAIAELAAIASANDAYGAASQNIAGFGPTTIQSVIFPSSDGQGLFPNQPITINTGLGAINLTAAETIKAKTGDIAIILPESEGDATATAERALLAANSIATTQAVNNAAPLDTVALSGWPALFTATSILTNQSPNGQAALAGKTAGGGNQFTNSVLFFLAAAKNGNPSAWIGNESESQLAKTNANLLETLKRDIGRLFANSNEANGEWRPVSIPLDTRAPDIPFVTLLVRNDTQENNQNKGQTPEGKGTKRFILEVDFKNIGAIQLDGFIKSKRFDLTIRSHSDLPKGLSGELRSLFSTALDANGFSGSLLFEEEVKFPVNVQAVLSETSLSHGQEQVS